MDIQNQQPPTSGKNKKTLWIIVAIVAIFIYIVYMFDKYGSGDSSPIATPPAIQKEVKDVSATNQQQETKKEPEKPLSLTDKLWVALDSSMKKRDGYEISLDENTKEIQISYASKDFWDESSLVREAYTLLVKYGREAFKIEGIDLLTVKYKTEFTDNYGKQSMGDAVIITMSKQEFNKFEWDNFKMLSVYKQIEGSALKYYIHPAVKSKLNYDKLYLSL